MTRRAVIGKLRKELPSLSAEYGVTNLALYGSFAKGSQTQVSDIDILVELSRPLGLDFIGLAQRLEATLGGRKVDLATFDSLRQGMKNPRKKHIAEDVKKSLLYA